MSCSFSLADPAIWPCLPALDPKRIAYTKAPSKPSRDRNCFLQPRSWRRPAPVLHRRAYRAPRGGTQDPQHVPTPRRSRRSATSISSLSTVDSPSRPPREGGFISQALPQRSASSKVSILPPPRWTTAPSFECVVMRRIINEVLRVAPARCAAAPPRASHRSANPPLSHGRSARGVHSDRSRTCLEMVATINPKTL